MDPDSALDELFSAPTAEFTSLRDDMVKQARSSGDVDLVARLRGLRRPTVAAWLVNQVARRHPDDVARLAEVGEALRAAHHDLDGDRLRALSARRQEINATLTGYARAVAEAADHPFGDATAEQVARTWTAAATDQDAADAVRAGRLTIAPSPGEQDWLAVAVAGPAPARKASNQSKQAETVSARPAPAERQAPDRAALRAARADLDKARRALDKARRAEETARRDATAASAAVADLRTRLADITDRLAEATADERATAERSTVAGAATSAADRAVLAARRRVAELTGE